MERVRVRFEGDEAAATDRIAVPARRLLNTLRALPDLPVTFASSQDLGISLRTDHGEYNLAGTDGGDYPAFPELPDGQAISLDRELLRRAISKTSFAVSKDPSRPAMNGVYFQLGADSGRMVATDGHRLVKFTLESIRCDEPHAFVVPEKALALSGRITGDEKCAVLVNKRHVSFDFGGSRIIARLIEAAYPNYEAVIPKNNDKRLTIDRSSLLAAVNRVGLYSSSTSKQVRIHFSKNNVKLEAEDIDRSSKAYEMVECDYSHEDMLMAFNSDYLAAVLKNVDSEHVVFEFGLPDKAGLVTPVEQKETESITMLIMPVMLNKYA